MSSRQRADQLAHPEKHKARESVNRAISRGDLSRPAVCSCCELANGMIEAHHEDYSRPLEVVWYCKTCHGARHRVINRTPGHTLLTPLSGRLVRMEVHEYTCERCGFVWLSTPGIDDPPTPKGCRSCRSPAWNKARVRAPGGGRKAAVTA